MEAVGVATRLECPPHHRWRLFQLGWIASAQGWSGWAGMPPAHGRPGAAPPFCSMWGAAALVC